MKTEDRWRRSCDWVPRMRFFIDAPSTAEWVDGFCAGLLVAVIFLLRYDYREFKRKEDVENS